MGLPALPSRLESALIWAMGKSASRQVSFRYGSEKSGTGNLTALPSLSGSKPVCASVLVCRLFFGFSSAATVTSPHRLIGLGFCSLMHAPDKGLAGFAVGHYIALMISLKNLSRSCSQSHAPALDASPIFMPTKRSSPAK